MIPTFLSKYTRPRLWILCLEILAPLLVLWLAGNLLLASGPVLRALDRYRPAYSPQDLVLHVVKQTLHVEANHRLITTPDQVIFLGSSSVVNGLDSDLVNQQWRREGFGGLAVNDAMTGFFAYELPYFKDIYLDRRVSTVVYLYNLFSFSDHIHPQAAIYRFDLAEAHRLGALAQMSPGDLARAVLNQYLYLSKYKPVLRELAQQALTGRLRPLPHPYDYDPNEPLPAPRAHVVEPPAQDWLRVGYEDSVNRPDSLGYAGLARFVELARARGLRVVIAPIPVPDFAATLRYRVGLDAGAVDRRVAEIAREHGAICIPRSQFKDLEADDGNFRDHVHLHRVGRERFSRRVAQLIAQAAGN